MTSNFCNYPDFEIRTIVSFNYIKKYYLISYLPGCALALEIQVLTGLITYLAL